MKKDYIYPIITAALLFFANTAASQVNKTLHQTFELDAQTNLVQFNILGDIKLESWAGSQILIETKVLLEGATQEILDYVTKKGRYEIESHDLDLVNAIGIRTKYSDRKMIKYKDVECFEEVKVKVFYPEELSVFNRTNIMKIKE